ncbi:hypothetical protein GF314_11080 [bacterium]|nr:hypothetical protein [bacterium]
MSDPSRTGLAERLGRLDRRWLYLVLLVAVGVSVVLRPLFPDQPSVFVRPVFERIERLEPGQSVLVSLDYSPVSAPEIEPMAFAITRHVLLRGAHPVFVTLFPEGPAMYERLRVEVLERDFPELVAGRDWTMLGYKAGGRMVINAMRQEMAAMFAGDAEGRRLGDLPGLRGYRRLGDFPLVVSLSSGTPGLKEWILYGGDPSGVPVVGGCTGIGTPEYLAYFPSQLQGILGGLKGASEYEAALADRHPGAGFPRRAGRVMGPQTVAHVVILLFLVLGNVAYLRRPGRRQPEERP